MTTDSALFPASEMPGLIPELFLPPGFKPGAPAQILDGIPAWFVGDCDDDEYRVLYVHTHREDRALEIAARMAREFDSEYSDPEITDSGWCLLATVCGCTKEQHTAHEAAEAAAFEAGDSVEPCAGCRHPCLAPCSGDPSSWAFEAATADAPGALPYLRVELS